MSCRIIHAYAERAVHIAFDHQMLSHSAHLTLRRHTLPPTTLVGLLDSFLIRWMKLYATYTSGLCMNTSWLTRSIFSDGRDLKRFKRAEITIKVTQCRRYRCHSCHSLDHTVFSILQMVSSILYRSHRWASYHLIFTPNLKCHIYQRYDGPRPPTNLNNKLYYRRRDRATRCVSQKFANCCATV